MFFTSLLADIGISMTVFIIGLVLLIMIAYLVYTKLLMKPIHRNIFLVALFVLLVASVSLAQSLYVASFEGEKFERGEWQEAFNEALSVAGFNPSEDLANTPYYDYENPIIMSAADKMASESRSAGEAVNAVLRYVYDNVKYDSFESDAACFDGTAPGVLDRGTGQCDTQSIVVISMLRRMGIPARPVGGCVVVNPDTCMFQSMFLQSFQDAGLAPKFTEAVGAESDAVFSRTQTPGGVGRAGGLHAWVVAWLPDEGWVHLEATTGKRVNHKCYYYHVELFPENNQKSDICVSKNFNYAQACRANDLALLDVHGLGLAEEVSVR
jgi:transglutaminase-like putative cysteine protease